MQKLTLLTAAVLISIGSFGQSKSADNFYNKYKDDRDASLVTLNGSIFQLVASIAGLAEDDDAAALARIADGIKSMKILALPMYKAGINMSEIEDLRSNIIKEGYDELMTVRDGKERVYFLAKTNENQINDMLILSHKADDELALIKFEGVLEMKDVAYLVDHHDDWRN